MYRKIVSDDFPEEISVQFKFKDDIQTLTYRKVTWEIGNDRQGLRYGENPDQPAALYRLVDGALALGDVRSIEPGTPLITAAELLQSGKHPGKINITDVDSALNILRYLDVERPAAVIVKHNNPSGVAYGDTRAQSVERAFSGDSVAAFGGVVTLNQAVDIETAEVVSKEYFEVIAAPEYEEGVLERLSRRKNLRVFRIGNMDRLRSYTHSRVVDFASLMDGGLAVQWSFVPKMLRPETLEPASSERKGVTYRIERVPTDRERRDMVFGWMVEAGVTSNSVLYVKDEQTIAIGTGEQDRVGVAEIARDKAYRNYADLHCREQHGTPLSGAMPEQREEAYEAARRHDGGLGDSTMVSDAFFPFADGVEVGLREGVSAVLQPGGALRDGEVIDACNRYGATMVFTGQRSFKH